MYEIIGLKAKAGYVPTFAEELRGTVSDEKFLSTAAWVTMMEIVVTEFRPNVRYKIFTGIDCSNRQSRKTAIYTYSDRGTLSARANWNAPFVPDSIFEKIGRNIAEIHRYPN